MSTSAFGIDHGESFSKAKDPNTGKRPSGGRRALAAYNPGLHSIVAGRKGKKTRAVGNEYGGALLGSAGGAGIGGGIGALATRGKGPGALIGAATGSLAGSIGGSQVGLNRNQRKGYLKPEGQ